jgi:glutathione S-transferase
MTHNLSSSKGNRLMSNNMVLYVDSRFLSPYALSVFVALQEKELAFDLRSLDLGVGEHRAADYAATSLTGRVPTLVHGDFSLSESSAICEYLDEAFPAPRYPSLYPDDRRQRARARQLQAWLRSDFMPLRQERSTEAVFLQPTANALSADATAAAQKLFFAAEALLPDGADNLFGAWCIADTDLALMLNRLVLNGDTLVPPRLATYARRQWQRTSVRNWCRLSQIS